MNVVDKRSLLEFIATYRDNFAARSLMYAGPDLSNIECMWHMFSTFEDFANGDAIFAVQPGVIEAHRTAYTRIAEKYNCGSSTLADHVKRKMCKDGHVTREAAEELIRCLKEVDALRTELRSSCEKRT